MRPDIILWRENIEDRYFMSFDVLRVICITALILASFGLPFIPYFDFLRPYLNSATGILFTLYGFLVLRDGADLRENIKHTARVFLIFLAVYGLITMGYLWLFYRKPFMYFNVRGIFNFVVLNFWGEDICSTIWYVQSTLYALIILWLLRRFKDYDWLLCIVLFAVSILIGELAEVINFSFLGNDYIPGNFLTRTIPYMLLGRLIYKYYDRLAALGRTLPAELIVFGFIMSVIEFFALYFFDKLGYTNHLIGFVFIAAGACLKAAESYSDPGIFGRCAGKMYKPMYYIFNPLYFLLLTVGLLICRTTAQYYYLNLFAGLAVVILTFGGCFLYAWIAVKIERKARLKARAEQKRRNREKPEDSESIEDPEDAEDWILNQ